MVTAQVLVAPIAQRQGQYVKSTPSTFCLQSHSVGGLGLPRAGANAQVLVHYKPWAIPRLSTLPLEPNLLPELARYRWEVATVRAYAGDGLHFAAGEAQGTARLGRKVNAGELPLIDTQKGR